MKKAKLILAVCMMGILLGIVYLVMRLMFGMISSLRRAGETVPAAEETWVAPPQDEVQIEWIEPDETAEATTRPEPSEDFAPIPVDETSEELAAEEAGRS